MWVLLRSQTRLDPPAPHEQSTCFRSTQCQQPFSSFSCKPFFPLENTTSGRRSSLFSTFFTCLAPNTFTRVFRVFSLTSACTLPWMGTAWKRRKIWGGKSTWWRRWPKFCLAWWPSAGTSSGESKTTGFVLFVAFDTARGLTWARAACRQAACSGHRAESEAVEASPEPAGDLQPPPGERPELLSGGETLLLYVYIFVMNVTAAPHSLIASLSHPITVLTLPAGSGEADPPDAVWAVHRVPGAPFGSAAQQQRRESRRRGAARLHPGSHQTARFLLQVPDSINLSHLFHNSDFSSYIACAHRAYIYIHVSYTVHRLSSFLPLPL